MKKLEVFIVTAVVAFSVWFYRAHPLQPTVRIRNEVFAVDLAITPKEKERGLGGRERLVENKGMLFVYDHKERYPFWMKDMRFPIDIVWIEGKTIVDISKNVPAPRLPNEQLPIYRPIAPVDIVLELPAGTADRVGMTIGDKITIKS